MGIDALRETGPSISEEGETGPYNGTATPEQLFISADLERVYDETNRDGSDESTANSTAIEKVLGKSKGLGIKSSSTRRFSSTPSDVEIQMKLMQEQMQMKDEQVNRLEQQLQETLETMQEQMQVKDKKVDRLEEQLQETRGILNTLLERFKQQELQSSTSTRPNNSGV